MFNLEARDNDCGSGIADIQMFIDGEPCNIEDQCSWTQAESGYYLYISRLSRGEHNIFVRVCDAASNCTDPNSVKILVIDDGAYAAVDGPYVSAEREHNGWYSPSASVRFKKLADVGVLLDSMRLETSYNDGWGSFEVSEDGNHVVTFMYPADFESSESGRSEYNLFVPVDRTPPEFNWSYRLVPDVVIDVSAEDNVSGVGVIRVCMDGSCSFAADGTTAVFPLSLGEHNVTISVWDVAGNVAERNEVLTVELNDLIGDLNAPTFIAASPVMLSWQVGALYAGPYVLVYDGNAFDMNSVSAELNVVSGTHRVCVAVPGYLDINRCAEFNADLAPPVVHVSAPSRTSSRDVTISWSAADDFAVVSSTLSVDGSARTVGTSGSMTVHLFSGSHTVCVTATDAAGRASSECTRIYVRRHHNHSSVSHSLRSPAFPRDDIDREFRALITSAGFESAKIVPISEDKGYGTVGSVVDIVRHAGKEFGRMFAPVDSNWIARKYSVGGKTFTFVIRKVPETVDRVYEYFTDDVRIYSDYLVSEAHGSLLAEFAPRDGKYSYAVESSSVGVSLCEVPPPATEEAPAPKAKKRPTAGVNAAPPEEPSVEEAYELNTLGSGQVGTSTVVSREELRKPPMTPFAILVSSNRFVFAGLLLVVGAVALSVASILERR